MRVREMGGSRFGQECQWWLAYLVSSQVVTGLESNLLAGAVSQGVQTQITAWVT